MSGGNELRERIAEYGSFISNTLQPQLQTAVDAREETEAEISEYSHLRNQLQLIEQRVNQSGKQDEEQVNNNPSTTSTSLSNKINNTKCPPLHALVDISHATVYCNATIPNPRTVYVHIGFGFHAEFTLSEAIQFIDRRLEYLEEEVLKHRSNVAEGVAEDVEKALELLEELGEDLSELERA